MKRLRYVLIGDGESPHLLKWARALESRVELWVVSSRGFLAGFDALLPTERLLSLTGVSGVVPSPMTLLWRLPRMARWLRQANPDWINPHYLTSHGTLVWLAKMIFRVPGRVLGSAWGSDILTTPKRSPVWAWLTRRVLTSCQLTTSDSLHMAQQMRLLGAREVVTFPFGLESMPTSSQTKEPWLFFSNRGLAPLYQPMRVLECFASVSAVLPQARLVVANGGPLKQKLEDWIRVNKLADRVRFVGRLDAAAQNSWYAKAQWYLSLPATDSVSVSVLEAMAHGCIPVLSDLPANRELVRNMKNGMLLGAHSKMEVAAMRKLLVRSEVLAIENRNSIEAHGLIGPCVERLIERLL